MFKATGGKESYQEALKVCNTTCITGMKSMTSLHIFYGKRQLKCSPYLFSKKRFTTLWANSGLRAPSLAESLIHTLNMLHSLTQSVPYLFLMQENVLI